MNITDRHKQQINRVCDYISTHIDDDINLETMSRVAACSKYHFHRVFKLHMGISTIQFVQLSRMKRASFRLAFEVERTITDIGYEAHFDSPEAFSRAFSRIFGQTPSEFRRQPDWEKWHEKYQFTSLAYDKNTDSNGGITSMDVKIVDFKQQNVAFIEHKGSPKRILETVMRFVAWRKSSGLSPLKTSKTFGIPYSDPNDTLEQDFRFDVCGTLQGNVPDNEFGVKGGTIPAGRCAVARHQGSHLRLSDTVYYLYQQWLPQSNETLRDFPCFFQYLNFVHQVNESELITDVYLPIK